MILLTVIGYQFNSWMTKKKVWSPMPSSIGFTIIFITNLLY